MIHQTVGVYPNGQMKQNGVVSENLANHIGYNLDMRPGRALILDGVVIYRGNVSDAELVKALEVISKNPKAII